MDTFNIWPVSSAEVALWSFSGLRLSGKEKKLICGLMKFFRKEISSLAPRALHFLFAKHFTGNQINYLLFSGVEVKTSLSERERRGSN